MLALRSLRSVRLALLIMGAIGVASCGGSTDGDGTCPGSAPYCVPAFCGGDVLMNASCHDGDWQCPSDHVFIDECPPDSCFTVPTFCCDALGNQYQATCPDRGGPVCAPGLTPPPLFEPCPKPPGCELGGCGENELCTFADRGCGANEPGICREKPASCDDIYDPVCGCDGEVYGNSCAAQQAGVDLGTSCVEPPGMHLCGTELCQIGSEYCEVGVGEATVACKPLPPGCGPSPSCACLSGEPCGALCSDGGDGSFKLGCQ